MEREKVNKLSSEDKCANCNATAIEKFSFHCWIIEICTYRITEVTIFKYSSAIIPHPDCEM